MKGLFSKLMNKFNDPSSQAKSNNSSQPQKQAQPQNLNSNKNKTTTNISNNNIIMNNSPSNIQTKNQNVNTNQKNINNINDNVNATKPKLDNQIVIVNERHVENNLKGFYYKKHIDDIRKLKVSEPIIYQRQKMKVNFDIDILDYLFNDMTEIFKMKSNLVEENKNELIKKLNETYDLVNILNEFNKNSDDILNKYMKQKKIMDSVEMMEIFVRALSKEVDDLLSDITKFEVKMKKEMEENQKQNEKKD